MDVAVAPPIPAALCVMGGKVRNEHVVQRLAGIQSILNGVHEASSSMSSSAKGSERESFIDEFLAKVLPPIYRFGSGDATDELGNKSGQLDVVVEYPFSPTLPSVGASQSRLYLAESVAAVIEVKSNISGQWDQASQTACKLAPLKRRFGGGMTVGGGPPLQIPMYVVSYTGWKQVETVKDKLASEPNIAGVLIINSGVFVGSEASGGMVATGPLALWGLICSLHQVTTTLQTSSTNPLSYVV